MQDIAIIVFIISNNMLNGTAMSVDICCCLSIAEFRMSSENCLIFL